MALVTYSDSESDGESVSAPPPKLQTPQPATKAGFQKAAPGKIQVSLPSLKRESDGEENGAAAPPAKRVRTGGPIGGFNALLPAPKRTVQNGPKKGVSLKTSSEAAFSREAVPERSTYQEAAASMPLITEDKNGEPPEEPKLVGKATRFLPLSVSAKKKKKPIPKPPVHVGSAPKKLDSATTIPEPVATQPDLHVPKPKKSLFSMSQDAESQIPELSTGQYESVMIEQTPTIPEESKSTSDLLSSAADPSSLQAVAADMNLTPAQRRQLFGRNGKDAKVTHFNLDAEYRNNEKLRESGEVVEHKAVKAVASGKHSLQQLVNNARTQEDALEDKWADGRRNRGEAGSKYGFGRG